MKMRAVVHGLLCGVLALAAAPAAAGAAVGGDRAASSPILKVVDLLKSMAAKGEAARQEEETKYAAFRQWCKDETKRKLWEIQTADDEATLLKADIAKAESRIQELNARVQELDADVSRWQADQKAATEVREKEAEDYRATHEDYTESLNALDQAVLVLKKRSAPVEQPELLQMVAKVGELPLVPERAKHVLATFLQQGRRLARAGQPDIYSPPEAAAYEFQSGGVIEMLKKLRDEFADKKSQLEMEEMNSLHNYEQLMQSLADSVSSAQHEASRKRTGSATTAQLKAEAEGSLAQTSSDRAEDQKYFEGLKELCLSRASDFAARQKLRGEELEAIRKAADIISGDTVRGAGERHLGALSAALLQQRAALAQLRSERRDEPLQDTLARFLAGRAQSTGSKLLSLVAERAAVDPFEKVKKMIKDLVVKLMEEATAETEHKGWCDAELGANKVSRDSKTAEVSKLNAGVEDLTAEIAELGQSVSELASSIADLASAMATAAAERTASKEKNEQTIEDAKAATDALQRAIGLLKEYYARAGESTALVQQTPAEDAPETFSAPYRGMASEGGSVIDFLEVILADFTRLQTDAENAESTEVDEFKKFSSESERDKALKENEKAHKEDKISEKESELTSTRSDLEATQGQLDKAIAYYDKLKPNCVDTGISYEERVKRREEEMQSLQEALGILTGTAIA